MALSFRPRITYGRMLRTGVSVFTSSPSGRPNSGIHSSLDLGRGFFAGRSEHVIQPGAADAETRSGTLEVMHHVFPAQPTAQACAWHAGMNIPMHKIVNQVTDYETSEVRVHVGWPQHEAEQH